MLYNNLHLLRPLHVILVVGIEAEEGMQVAFLGVKMELFRESVA